MSLKRRVEVELSAWGLGALIADNLLYAYASLLVAKLRGEDALLTFKDICEKYQIRITEEEKIKLELAGHRHYSIEGFLTMMWVSVRHAYVNRARDWTCDCGAGAHRCVPGTERAHISPCCADEDGGGRRRGGSCAVFLPDLPCVIRDVRRRHARVADRLHSIPVPPGSGVLRPLTEETSRGFK
jgi:hypothetical protein